MPKKKLRNHKKLNPVFHIFCEGKKTEPYYIRAYIDHYHSDKRNVLVVEDTKKNTPVQLVDDAIDSKKYCNKGDIFNKFKNPFSAFLLLHSSQLLFLCLLPFVFCLSKHVLCQSGDPWNAYINSYNKRFFCVYCLRKSVLI